MDAFSIFAMIFTISSKGNCERVKSGPFCVCEQHQSTDGDGRYGGHGTWSMSMMVVVVVVMLFCMLPSICDYHVPGVCESRALFEYSNDRGAFSNSSTGSVCNFGGFYTPPQLLSLSLSLSLCVTKAAQAASIYYSNNHLNRKFS